MEYWIKDATDDDDELPISAGYSPSRDLKILSRTIPAIPAEIETRGFTERDCEEIIRINNAAFHWHPEQSGMTETDLKETQSEAWYLDEDFRILEVNNELQGFCWMKVHGSSCSCCDKSKILKGEIFVIAVDPLLQGKGLGRQLALAGLDWMAKKKIREVFLYVESDNYPALKTYDSLGFEHISINLSVLILVMDNSDDFIVPANHYFFLGDNRDCSKDSRFLSSVGYVHENNMVGKAQFIFFSSDYRIGSVFNFWKWNDILRVNRFFKKIH